MKIINTLFILSIITGSYSLQAQVVEDTLLVKGVCKMCKERIETAAYIKGVKFASWNNETDELSIAYREDKTSREEIQESLLKAGHNVGDTKPTDEAYNSLPGC
jgi:hypothetical protein